LDIDITREQADRIKYRTWPCKKKKKKKRDEEEGEEEEDKEFA